MRTSRQTGITINTLISYVYANFTEEEIVTLEGEAYTMETNEETIEYMDRILPGTREPLIAMTRAFTTIWRSSIEYHAAMQKVYKL